MLGTAAKVPCCDCLRLLEKERKKKETVAVNGPATATFIYLRCSACGYVSICRQEEHPAVLYVCADAGALLYNIQQQHGRARLTVAHIAASLSLYIIRVRSYVGLYAG